MDASQWRQYARLSIIESALSTAMGTLGSGVFLTGFALSLGAGRLAIGVLAALPSLASLAQLGGARLIENGMCRKTLCIRSLMVARLVWLAVAGIPLLAAIDPEWQVPALVVLVAVSSVFSSLGGVASLSWTREMVPVVRRLAFFGLKHQFNTILSLVLGLAGGAFLDWWNVRHPNSLGGFIAVLLAAVGCGLLAIPVLRRITSPSSVLLPVTCNATHHFAAASSPLRNDNFRNLVLFYLAWNVAANLATPFFAVFMLEKLGLPFWEIVLLQAVYSIAGLIANRYWTALGSRLGTRPVVFLATLGDAFYPLGWLFITPQNAWAIPMLFLFGGFGTPLAVGSQTLVMRLAPNEQASSYLGTFNAIMGLAMASAAIGGGYLAANVPSNLFSVGGISFGGLKLLFLLSFLGRFSSLLLLQRIAEPEAVDGRTALRHLLATIANRLRTTSGFSNS